MKSWSRTRSRFRIQRAAAQSYRDGSFDWSQFELKRRDELDWQVVRVIAERTISAHDLDERSDLKAALLAVYQAGKANRTG